jgi:hypothetical protein
MNTILIISVKKKFINANVTDYKKELNVNPANFHEIIPETSIGIDDIRKIQTIVKLSPFGGGNRLVVINNAEKATIAAQNALLKILEEPPVHNFIILVSSSLEKLIPTIQSRCQIVQDPEFIHKLNDKDNIKYSEIFDKILKGSPGQRICISMTYTKTREDALKFLDKLQTIARQSLFNKDTNMIYSYSNLATVIGKTIKAERLIEGNINYKGVVDALLLSFPKI